MQLLQNHGILLPDGELAALHQEAKGYPLVLKLLALSALKLLLGLLYRRKNKDK